MRLYTASCDSVAGRACSLKLEAYAHTVGSWIYDRCTHGSRDKRILGRGRIHFFIAQVAAERRQEPFVRESAIGEPKTICREAVSDGRLEIVLPD